jgi:hypothetical protein
VRILVLNFLNMMLLIQYVNVFLDIIFSMELALPLVLLELIKKTLKIFALLVLLIAQHALV